MPARRRREQDETEEERRAREDNVEGQQQEDTDRVGENTQNRTRRAVSLGIIQFAPSPWAVFCLLFIPCRSLSLSRSLSFLFVW